MDEVYQLLQGHISSEDIQQLVIRLSEIQERIQTLSPQIQEILISLSNRMPSIAKYNYIMRKIEFKLDYFNREIHYENGSLSRNKMSRKWAIQAVSIGDEGNQNLIFD